MAKNRIRRYQNVWDTKPAASQPPSLELPAGFTMLCLAHLNPDERQHIQHQLHLYQWAFEEARRKCDEEFINNWII
jgi:hypothetical protein